MTRQPFTSFLSAQIVAQNEVASFQPKATAAWFFIYRFSGTADLVMPNQSQLKRGDMLMLQNPGIRQIKIRARETCELIITEIWQLPYIG